MTNERAVPLDDEEQNARCRALWIMVLLRALLDASWSESAFMAARPGNTPNDQSVAHSRRAHRAAARRWLLAPVTREEVEAVADNAGLHDGGVWELVGRFVIAGEDPAPIRALYETIGGRPGRKNFVLDVPFVA